MKKLASFTKYAQKNVKLQKFHNLINIHEMTSQSHEGIFGYTPSQLRYTPKLKSIDNGLLQILPFQICPLTRRNVTYEDVTQIQSY